MFTKDSRLLTHRLTVPLTSVSKAVGDVFKPTFDQLIKSLFANGEQGFFYDPNDLSTMFQDAVGTIPVTAVGQPVGRILDKSGRNNHAYQTTSASRPILRQNAVTGANYLEFDGSDDFLRTNNIDFTGTDKVSLFAGVRKLNDLTGGVVIEFSDRSSSIRSFRIYAGESSLATGPHWSFVVRGNVNSFAVTPATYPSPISNVLAGKSDLTTYTVTLNVDGVEEARSLTDTGVIDYSNYPLYIGRRAGTSLPFNGHIYGLIGVGKLVSDAETLVIEKELAKRLGVTLNV